MKRVTHVELALLWVCVVWLVIVVAQLVPLWMWSGLHPSSFSQEQLDTVLVPVRKLREMDDRFRGERNGYLFQLAPAALALLVVLFRISIKPKSDETPSAPAR